MIDRFLPRAALLAASAGWILASGAAHAAPPPAPSTPVTEAFHGVEVTDRYRNLEDPKSPPTRAWLEAEGTEAQRQLDRIAGRDELAARIPALAESVGDQAGSFRRLPGDRVFYLRRRVGENQFKLVLRVGKAGEDRVLVDPELLAKASGVPHAINYFVPSWDGRRVAYGISAGGSEDASLHVLDVASGKDLGAPIPRVREELVHWTPDSRRLSYNQVRELPADAPATETYLDSTVYLIEPGAPAAQARPVFGPLVKNGLALERLEVAGVAFDPAGHYMLARTTDTTVPEGRIWVAPVAALDAQGAIPWRAVSVAADRITDAQMRGDTLYVRSYADAPRGRVLALPLRNPVLARARVVVPEPAHGVLDGFDLGAGRSIYAAVRSGFTSRVLRWDDGAGQRAGVDVAPRQSGSTFIVEDPAHAYREPWIATSIWTGPSRVFAVAADGSLADTGLRRGAMPPLAPEIEVHEVLVESHDGAQVPLAILHRKGLVRDGGNPTLLVGYGAYGHSFEAYFDPRQIAWLERGGVIAMANVRGGGADGDAWHRAGFKATKPNTWLDGIACAHYLIDQHYASPKTLGIWGTSAGGIFVGRAVTTAPELFAAAIFDVGLMDTLRAEFSANGITNISEFGTVTKPDEFKALQAMSTVAHIEPGRAYPAVLLIHGLNDPRVDVWHSAKAAALLQAASTSGKPVLLRLDGKAGHGIGSTAQQGYAKLADIDAFLLWQFGRLEAKSD
ncbi:MAG: prolyl oligopeptidase family serine peptidase [Burkholderiales bacterium]|nr:prolyl oligopeptidase family serine peptidase [Burkholderiales bacterium]